MGIGGINIWSLLIILAIVLLLFGTKRLKSLGGDLGGAIKGFKSAISDDKADADKTEDAKNLEQQAAAPAEATKAEDKVEK